MKQKTVKVILSYYNGIPSAVRELSKEKKELERSEQSAAAKNRLQEIGVKTAVVEMDRALVAGVLDGLAPRYKRVLRMRYGGGYSWGRISVEMAVPDSTVRHWCERALQRMGEALEGAPMVEELVERAQRARL